MQSPASDADRPSAPAGAAHGGHYLERLTVPKWWHPLGVVAGIVLGLEMSFIVPGVWGQLGVLVGFVALMEVLLRALGGWRVEVRDGRIRAGSWRLPVDCIRGVAVLEGDLLRAEMKRPDEGVHRVVRGYIDSAVLLDVDDPDDLPFWLVSTRHPQRLLAALARA